MRRSRVRSRRDRDVRLGYAGLVIGAGAFVGALVVTTNLVDVLPDLDLQQPVLAQEQRVVDGAQMRPRTSTAPGVSGTGDARRASAPVPGGRATPQAQPAVAPAPAPAPAPTPANPNPNPTTPTPTTPTTPTPDPDPAPGPGGPVSSVLNPVAATAAEVLDGLSGGATQPVSQGAVAVVGIVGELADGPLEGLRRSEAPQGCLLTCP
ncbi:hypothetical protein BKA08_000014 [Nocardioides marinisabuli]|uniref:Uncharacterized protein n=1 Tax=Nocardioides marinisabuli TaxID=419476 RepID=A0A7Y9JP44_9ACTN|nr:hypothetical protein [Nocardioides marinisabuli]NYD55776.1 hypothetical protein [Nocardioides marinisabuli]